MNLGTARELLSAALIGFGTTIAFVPLALAWLLASTERRLWVISGPSPFDHLGSGPLLLWLGIGALTAGAGLVWAGLRLRGHVSSPGR
jgi:hypothetical protein